MRDIKRNVQNVFSFTHFNSKVMCARRVVSGYVQSLVVCLQKFIIECNGKSG